MGQWERRLVVFIVHGSSILLTAQDDIRGCLPKLAATAYSLRILTQRQKYDSDVAVDDASSGIIKRHYVVRSVAHSRIVPVATPVVQDAAPMADARALTDRGQIRP